MESSEVYLISPIQLRNLELEQHPARNRNNAYDGNDELAHLTREQKEAKYDTLKHKIQQEGFRWKYPIIIILSRWSEERKNKKDYLLQGHHRLQIAIELKLPTVPVSFQTVDSARFIT